MIEVGLNYFSIVVGGILGAFFYIPVSQKTFTDNMLANKEMTPEVFIPSTIFGSCTMPIGLFIFGWTATTEIHWIFPLLDYFFFWLFFYFSSIV